MFRAAGDDDDELGAPSAKRPAYYEANSPNDDSFTDVSEERDGVDDIFTCNVCREFYEVPKILPACSHTFCRRCLYSLLTQPSPSCRLIQCPDCYMISNIDKKGFDGLQTNVALENMVNAKRQEYMQRPCDHPQQDGVERFICAHCDMSFCDLCRFGHMEQLKDEVGRIGAGIIKSSKELVAPNLMDGVEFFFRESARKAEAQVDIFGANVNETRVTALKAQIQAAKTEGVKNFREIIKEICNSKSITTLSHFGGAVGAYPLTYCLYSGEISVYLKALLTRKNTVEALKKFIQPSSANESIFEFDNGNVDFSPNSIQSVLSGADLGTVRLKQIAGLEPQVLAALAQMPEVGRKAAGLPAKMLQDDLAPILGDESKKKSKESHALKKRDDKYLQQLSDVKGIVGSGSCLRLLVINGQSDMDFFDHMCHPITSWEIENSVHDWEIPSGYSSQMGCVAACRNSSVIFYSRNFYNGQANVQPEITGLIGRVNSRDFDIDRDFTSTSSADPYRGIVVVDIWQTLFTTVSGYLIGYTKIYSKTYEPDEYNLIYLGPEAYVHGVTEENKLADVVRLLCSTQGRLVEIQVTRTKKKKERFRAVKLRADGVQVLPGITDVRQTPIHVMDGQRMVLAADGDRLRVFDVSWALGEAKCIASLEFPVNPCRGIALLPNSQDYLDAHLLAAITPQGTLKTFDLLKSIVA